MKRKQRILFATDFSPGSKVALQTLKFLQPIFQFEVYFTHVLESFWKNWFSSGILKKELSGRLKTWQELLTKKPKKKYRFVEIGNPTETILSISSRIKADMIVMGGNLIGKSHRYSTGTTVESVVRTTKKSVLICKNTKISKILCGIDGSRHSVKALKKAIELSSKLNASLCITFVMNKVGIHPFGMSNKEINKREERYKENHVKKIMKLLEQFNFKNIPVKTYFPWGNPADIILNQAEDKGYDLIIVGAKGHSLLHHIFIGSTAEKILRHSPCSLFLVR